MGDNLTELLPVAVELGLIKFAFKEFGNDFVFLYRPDLSHSARRADGVAQRNPDFELGTEGCFLGAEEWDRHCQKQQHHDYQLNRDDLLQGIVKEINSAHNRPAETELKPAHIADLAGNLVTHEHYTQ